MQPLTSDELRCGINYSIMTFNKVTGDNIPSMYLVSYNPTSASLMRMRMDFDDIADSYNFENNELVKNLYLQIRERIEALYDMKKYEPKNY